LRRASIPRPRSVTPFTTSVHFSVDEIGALLLKSTNCTLAPTSTLSFEDRHKLTRILLHLHSGGLGALDGAAPPYVQLMSDMAFAIFSMLSVDDGGPSRSRYGHSHATLCVTLAVLRVKYTGQRWD
jgi:hypothetical protein